MAGVTQTIGPWEATIYDDGDLYLDVADGRWPGPDEHGVIVDFADLERLYFAAKARRESA